MPADWILGIESTAPRGSLVLRRGDEDVAAVEFEARPNHSAPLGRALASVLEALPPGVRLAVVVVGTGPGSYNGARVGIAAGQGVALVHGCATVGLSSLEGVAGVRSGGPALAVGDARRDSFFVVPLDRGRVTGGAELMAAAEFAGRVRGAVAEGRRLFSLEDTGRLPLPGDLAGAVEPATPEARLLVAAWSARDGEERERLREPAPQPWYLRPPHITKAKTRTFGS